MATQHTPKVSVTVQIELAPVNTNNRLAEGTLVFKGGPLDGCSLVGFTIWHSRNGHGENVTFPARSYVNGSGDKRTYAFVQGDAASLSQLREVVLEAYRHASKEAAAEA
jgi:hypothetical protein